MKEQMLKKCHDHMETYKNKIKVIMNFYYEEDAYVLYHLAQKYTDGCVEQLLREFINRQIKENFLPEIEAEFKNKTNLEESKNGTVKSEIC